MSDWAITAAELFDLSNHGFREELRKEKKAKNERSSSSTVIQLLQNLDKAFFSWMFLLSLCNITRRLACFRIKVIFPSYNDSWLPQLPLSNSDITSKQIYITYWDHINKQGCWNLKAQYSSRIAVLFLTQNYETGVTTDTRVYRKSTQYIMWQQETGMPIWKLRMTRLEIPSQSLGLLLVFTVKSCSGEGRH